MPAMRPLKSGDAGWGALKHEKTPAVGIMHSGRDATREIDGEARRDTADSLGFASRWYENDE